MSIRIQRILLPTDFSTYSDKATEYACELVARFDAELPLLHTLEPDFGLGVDLPKYINASRETAEKSLTSVLDPQWSARRTVVQAVVEGSPKLEIIRYARKHDIDLIVLATHGRSDRAHVIIGSVAESVVRTAPCPVLTVRSEGHHFAMP